MSVKGSTALVRLAGNPACEILGAMVMQEGSEKRFYEQVVGQPYDREFGERQSSKRRGAQFERNAYAGDARLLRETLNPLIGVAPDDIRVRNLIDEYPGTKDDARIARLNITRKILQTSIAGGSFPHLIIQPQLLIPTSPGPRPYFFIAPDLLIWSAQHSCYLPGDLKSFIVRENEVSKGDLARVRLQLGAQVLALRHEYHRLDQMSLPPAIGVLTFSKPNSLSPHAPRIEDLGGAVEAIRIGIDAFLRHRQRIDALRAGGAPFTVVADLEPNFQDACLASCVMAHWCRDRVAGRAADLGDVAGEVLEDRSLDHLIDLMEGRVQPSSEREQIIAERVAGYRRATPCWEGGMNAFEESLHRVIARHSRRVIPMRTSSSISPDPAITVGIATIKIVTEEHIQAVAFGPLDSAPQVVERLDPIGRDVTDLLPFAHFLNGVADRSLQTGTSMRIWVPHEVTIEALDVLGHRYANNQSAPEEIRRMGQICRIIAHEARIPGQQLIANAAALLQDHCVTGLAPIEEGHLDAILAWLDPAVLDPLVEARNRIRLPASGMLPNTPDHPIDDRIDRLRREAKAASGTRRHTLEGQIRSILREWVTREWELLTMGRRGFHSLGLPASGLDDLVSTSRNRVEKLEWQKIRERNEALDCRVYARAAAWIAGADRWPEATWADLEAQLGVPSGMDSPAGMIGRPDPGTQGKRRSEWLGRREGWF